jgi:hypothetical protein
LTGKAGRYDVGVLDIRTREATIVDPRTRENRFVDAKNFFVTRVKRNVFTQSYIGGIYTDGNPAGSSFARTYGADLRLSTSRFLGGRRNFNVDAYALRVRNEGVEDKTGSYGFAVSYPNDSMRLCKTSIGRSAIGVTRKLARFIHC